MDGRRPVGQALKDAQEMAGLPPGVWRGRGLAALGLTAGQTVTERQMELLFGEGRHPDADRMERELLDDGEDPETARLATVFRQPIEEIEQREQIPLLALDFVFRPQASLAVLWALGDARTRRVIERAHERAVAATLRWLEDEVAETRWASGRRRAKAPALAVAAFRHFNNRNGFPLLHEHCLILNRVQRPDGSWYELDTVRLYKHIVEADTLYTLEMTTEVCEKLGLATVRREVTPGLRPVMEIAGVDQELIDWSSTRRRRIEDVLEGITDEYVKKHGHLPGERPPRSGVVGGAGDPPGQEDPAPAGPAARVVACLRAPEVRAADGRRAASAVPGGRGGDQGPCGAMGRHRARHGRCCRGRLHRARGLRPPPRPGRSATASAGDPARPRLCARHRQSHRRPGAGALRPSAHRAAEGPADSGSGSALLHRGLRLADPLVDRGRGWEAAA